MPLFWLLGLLLPAIAWGEGDDAKAWLSKLNNAVQSLNYDGTFVFLRDGEIETMRILHGYNEHGVRERLVSLTGEAREVIRDRDVLTCVWPAAHSVVVESSRARHGVPAVIPMTPEELAPHYKVRVGDLDRVAGIECRYIEILPQDAYRYGHRLCADVDTGMLLKSAMLDTNGKVIESVIFTRIEYPQAIPPEQFEPSMNREGYTWHTVAAREHLANLDADPAWRLSALPPGFKLRENLKRFIAASREPVQHMVLGDGLASVSIFVNPPGAETREVVNKLKHSGAMHAYQTRIAGHPVTVVGEVPENTVNMIAAALKYGAGEDSKP